MTASVRPSSAARMNVEHILGYQAMCNDDACQMDPTGVWGNPGWFRWWGKFEKNWIMAKIEATAHNLEKHGLRSI